MNHYTTLLLVLIVVGIWYGSAQTGGSTAIVKWFPDKHRGLAIGIRQTGIPIGGALASTVLTYLYQHHHLSSVHLAQGLMAIGGDYYFYCCTKNQNSMTPLRHLSFPLKKRCVLFGTIERSIPYFCGHGHDVPPNDYHCSFYELFTS